jgi:hypothetical protein
MKKQFGLLILLFGLIYNCHGQSKTITDKKEHELQTQSNATSNLLILKRRASIIPMTLILDDRDTFLLIGKQVSKRTTVYQRSFLIKNIPQGDHKIHVSCQKVRRFKDSLNYTFYFQSNGNGNTQQKWLPKLRYNNRTQILRGILYSIDAAILAIAFTIKGAE